MFLVELIDKCKYRSINTHLRIFCLDPATTDFFQIPQCQFYLFRFASRQYILTLLIRREICDTNLSYSNKMAWMRRNLLMSFFLLINFIPSIQTSPLSPYLVHSFSNTYNTTLNHFTVSANGSVYIGAVDSLYHLSENFGVQSQVEFRNRGERNVNKVLEVIPFPVNELISCGSGLNGTCQIRNLNEISQDVRYLSPLRLKIAPEDDSTVGLVVEEASERISLYIAQTVKVEARFSRRPISSVCLQKRDQVRCREDGDDDRKTNILGTGVVEDFIIHYVAVFSYQGYTYYLASQRKDATSYDSPIVTKMSRVCHDDETEGLSGFTEITIGCNGTDGTQYSIAQSATEVNGTLYVAFIKNSPVDGPDLKGTNQSALCKYEMKTLITEFEDSIVNCSCNSQYRDHSTYLTPSECNALVDCDVVKEFTCYPLPRLASKYPQRSSSLGILPGLLVFEANGSSFSSVIVTEIDQPISGLVAFIGTIEGNLLKVRFDAGLRSTDFLYETLEMGSSVLSDTWINPRGDTVMFLTEKELLEIRLANCSQYETCDECIKPGSDKGDPYCGWCTLEKRCTKYKECKSSNIPSRWLWYNETICPDIIAVTPSSLSVDVHSRTVDATVSHFPMPDKFNYVCHFGSFFTSAATLRDGTISCLSPGEKEIPGIPDGDDAVDVVFAISSTAFNISFVSISYSFFNCSRIARCLDCVSKWSCDWCLDELLCTYNLDSMCNNITSITNDAGDFCPFLLPGKTVVPSGVKREIKVLARNLNLTPHLLGREYECVVKAEENSQMTFLSNANITRGLNDEYNVTCSKRKYTYSLEEQEVQTVLSLKWKNTDVFLDGNFSVTLYKCHIDRPDCSRCLSNITTRPELECGWCNNPQGFCTVEESCSSGLLRECTVPPKVFSVSPTSSPIEGGTIVEINGTDLGQRFSDIVNISLAGVLCHHQGYVDNYQVGASLTCETGNSSYTREGKISLFFVNKAEAEYEGDQFSYNNPQISSFYPTIGPQSGGTLVSINGTHLQTGRGVRVDVGENSCHIVEHSSSTIVCRNQGLAETELSFENQSVSVNFDGNERLAKETFSYHKDPEVSDLMPKKAIRSGGNFLTVTGERFNVIQKPRIRFTIDGNSAEEDCSFQDQNGMEIICQSPNVAELLKQRQRRADSPAEGTVDVGFIMDGVTDLLNWSQNKSVVFQYFRDPSYETFGVLNLPRTTNNLLTLNGKDLNLASTDKDVTVFIGTQNCTVKSLEATTLICQLPSEPLTTGNLYGNLTSRDLPYIIVKHANLEFNIGYIRYTDEVAIFWLVILVAGAIVVLIIIFLLVSSTWHIWRKKAEEIRDLELEVQNIEKSVNANLKALFATLKTTMPNFETTIREQTRIPLLDQRQYLVNMMFHGLKVIPPALQTQEILKDPNMKIAMKDFSALLYHKSFLKVIITTLDKTTSLSPVKKANVGSLICACLLQDGKLEFYTDLLMSLMQEEIKECKSKEKLSLLFSRNETLVANLTSNWASIFLYGFLKQQAASEIYQLYEAIKYICEMGPIDAVSGKSQFSINDEQMLQTRIHFNEVQLDYAMKSGHHKDVKVLDVNAITQIKDTIISHNHRYLPYSQRPSPFALDLICRTSKSGLMVLRDDENLPGSLDNGWKKVNTLADYDVPGDASFELIPNEDYVYAAISMGTGRSDSADYHIKHTYHTGQEYLEILPHHSDEESNEMKMGKGVNTVPSDTNSGMVTKEENPNTATASNETLSKGDSTDYSHQLYGADDPNYEDIAHDTFNVATNGDMRQFKAKGYDVKMTEGVKLWHLIKEDKGDLGDYEDVPDPRVREETEDVALSFLPATVNNIQKFVNNLINAIFAANRKTEVPLSIKYMFQFFEREAEKAGKPEVAKAWKNNVLPLDFWSTIIANPHFVLDVGEYTYTHSSLKIIAQAVKDTCNGSDKTHKDQAISPSRLLYSHFLKGYISQLDNYYLYIHNSGRVDIEDFRRECAKVEKEFKDTFDLISTKQKLFNLLADHQKELIEALEDDNVCRELSHASKLRMVAEKMIN